MGIGKMGINNGHVVLRLLSGNGWNFLPPSYLLSGAGNACEKKEVS